MLAPGYVRARHPEHGEPVIFTPGEDMPAWVSDALEAGAELVAGDGGVLELRGPHRAAPPAGRKAAPKEKT